MAVSNHSNQKTILIAAGGTGGHVFPALAVAEVLRKEGYQISWLGTKNGIEAKLVPKAQFTIDYIPISGLRGKGKLAWLMMPFRLLKAIKLAKKIIQTRQPSLIIGMGGFVTGPCGLAARLSGVPLLLHEQNAIAGMTNRYLAKIANRVLCAFPNTFPAKIGAVVTGNPIRQSIVNLLDVPYQPNTHQPLRILVVGGSLGALILNQTVPAALALLPNNIRPEVMHQTGEKTLAIAKAEYEKQAVNANVVSFIEDMAAAYAWADIVICRAGALTIAELAAAKRPAILVPYLHAVDDHQRRNAEYLMQNEAAILILQKELTPQRLALVLQDWLSHPENLIRRSENAAMLAEPHATMKVVAHCKALLTENEEGK